MRLLFLLLLANVSIAQAQGYQKKKIRNLKKYELTIGGYDDNLLYAIRSILPEENLDFKDYCLLQLNAVVVKDYVCTSCPLKDIIKLWLADASKQMNLPFKYHLRRKKLVLYIPKKAYNLKTMRLSATLNSETIVALTALQERYHIPFRLLTANAMEKIYGKPITIKLNKANLEETLKQIEDQHEYLGFKIDYVGKEVWVYNKRATDAVQLLHHYINDYKSLKPWERSEIGSKIYRIQENNFLRGKNDDQNLLINVTRK